MRKSKDACSRGDKMDKVLLELNVSDQSKKRFQLHSEGAKITEELSSSW